VKTDLFSYKVALNTNQAVVNLEDTVFTSSKTHNFLLAGDHLKHALEVIVAGKNVKVLAAVPFGLLAELELSSASVMNIKKVPDHHEPVLPPFNFFILEH
jgi:CMP-N-acetylneuraminic acid synthetase